MPAGPKAQTDLRDVGSTAKVTVKVMATAWGRALVVGGQGLYLGCLPQTPDNRGVNRVGLKLSCNKTVTHISMSCVLGGLVSVLHLHLLDLRLCPPAPRPPPRA